MNTLSLSKFISPISALAVAVSLGLFLFWSPVLSIEFTGGTRIELVPTTAEITRDMIDQSVRTFPEDLRARVNTTQDGTFLIRTISLDNEMHDALIAHLQEDLGSEITEQQFTTIGPTVGESLKQRAVWALVLASIGIVLYLAFAFRKVPRKLSAWKFGVIAVITLLHDILITVGVFTVLSHTTSFEMDTLFVTALLTILGYSVNDTIIIFDRIRDNLADQARKESFGELANRAVQQSIRRSVYTSASTLIMLLSLYLLGSESIRWFVLTLIVGIGIGTYSSIFVATPLLVYWRKKERNV